MENLDINWPTKAWLYLRGKKTYIIGFSSIIGAVAKALQDNDWESALKTIQVALLAMGIRHAL